MPRGCHGLCVTIPRSVVPGHTPAARFSHGPPQMLWVKSFHIVFVVAWFAGLLYLPRLFVYHCQCAPDERAALLRFETMERRLFGIMTVGALGALGFGVGLLGWFGHVMATSYWLQTKLALVLGLVVFHLWCFKLMRDFRAGNNRHQERFYRIINEIPALALIAIVILVVVKPF